MALGVRSRGLLSDGGTGSSSGNGGLLSGSHIDGGGVDSAGLGGNLLSGRGGSLVVTLVVTAVGGLGGSVQTTGLSSRSQAVAVVAPDVKLEGTVEAAVEQLQPLGVVTVALVAGVLEGKACSCQSQ